MAQCSRTSLDCVGGCPRYLRLGGKQKTLRVCLVGVKDDFFSWSLMFLIFSMGLRVRHEDDVSYVRTGQIAAVAESAVWVQTAEVECASNAG